MTVLQLCWEFPQPISTLSSLSHMSDCAAILRVSSSYLNTLKSVSHEWLCCNIESFLTRSQHSQVCLTWVTVLTLSSLSHMSDCNAVVLRVSSPDLNTLKSVSHEWLCWHSQVCLTWVTAMQLYWEFPHPISTLSSLSHMSDCTAVVLRISLPDLNTLKSVSHEWLFCSCTESFLTRSQHSQVCLTWVTALQYLKDTWLGSCIESFLTLSQHSEVYLTWVTALFNMKNIWLGIVLRVSSPYLNTLKSLSHEWLHCSICKIFGLEVVFDSFLTLSQHSEVYLTWVTALFDMKNIWLGIVLRVSSPYLNTLKSISHEWLHYSICKIFGLEVVSCIESFLTLTWHS